MTDTTEHTCETLAPLDIGDEVFLHQHGGLYTRCPVERVIIRCSNTWVKVDGGWFMFRDAAANTTGLLAADSEAVPPENWTRLRCKALRITPATEADARRAQDLATIEAALSGLDWRRLSHVDAGKLAAVLRKIGGHVVNDAHVGAGTCTARPWPSCSRPDGQRLRHWADSSWWSHTGCACDPAEDSEAMP